MASRFFVIKTGPFSASEKLAISKLKSLDIAALKSMLGKGDARITCEVRNQDSYAVKDRVNQANQKAFIESYGSQCPELVKAILAASLTSSAKITTSTGITQFVPLKGKYSVIRNLLIAGSITKSPKQLPRLAGKIQEIINAALTKDPTLRSQFASMIKSQTLSTAIAGDAAQSMTSMLSFWQKYRDKLISVETYVQFPCSRETGIGRNQNTVGESTGDMTESNGVTRSTNYAANGLFKNYDFPLKPHLTCVRNQGNRGTCEAFSVIAATEALVSVLYNQKVNLSEQALWAKTKLDWYPEPFDFGDGHYAELDMLTQLPRGYVFSYESDWDYNPSYNRQEFGPPNLPPYYTNSADRYIGLPVSETNHQAEQSCYVRVDTTTREVVTTVSVFIEEAGTNLAKGFDEAFSAISNQPNGHWAEKTITEVITDTNTYLVCETTIPNPSSGYRLTGFLPFYSPLANWGLALSSAKLFLDNKLPIVWSFQVMPSFRAPRNGYVQNVENFSLFLVANQDQNGGHCALIVGYADNDRLPASAPPGEEGGYFIVKNSWGTLFGDCGYVYVPYKYVRIWSSCLTAVTAVVRQ